KSFKKLRPVGVRPHEAAQGDGQVDEAVKKQAGDAGRRELTRKIRVQMLLEDRKRANAVRAKISSELRSLLLVMKENIQELRRRRPDLGTELRGGGLVYENLYAKPYDRICEMRSALLQRFTQVYNDIEGLARTNEDNDEIVLRALQPIVDDLLEVLHLLIDGMATVREYRADLGADLLRGGDIYEKLYNAAFERINVVRDSLPILMNAVFARHIFRR